MISLIQLPFGHNVGDTSFVKDREGNIALKAGVVRGICSGKLNGGRRAWTESMRVCEDIIGHMAPAEEGISARARIICRSLKMDNDHELRRNV